MAEDDYESFWNALRPQRGQPVGRPESNPCTEVPVENRPMPVWGRDQQFLDLSLMYSNITPDPSGVRTSRAEGALGPIFQGTLEQQANSRARRWLNEIIRHIPATTTAAALITRASDAIEEGISRYTHAPGATMDGVDAIIQQELQPIVSLIIQHRRTEATVRSRAVENATDTDTTLEEQIAGIRALSRSLSDNTPISNVIQRLFGLRNEVDPPSPVAQTIQQEREVQNLLDRVAFTQPSFYTTWMNPEEGPPQLVALVRAFRDLGLAVDTHLQLGDEVGSSTLTLTVDNQVIRLESSGGTVRINLFGPPIRELTRL